MTNYNFIIKDTEKINNSINSNPCVTVYSIDNTFDNGFKIVVLWEYPNDKNNSELVYQLYDTTGELVKEVTSQTGNITDKMDIDYMDDTYTVICM